MGMLLKRIKIDKIGYGWVGLARMSDGKRILIKGWALPGSIVDLRVIKQKKDFVEAHITRIIELDKTIVDSEIFCPHFFSGFPQDQEIATEQLPYIWCGGCKWQMLSYPNQLGLKQRIVEDACTKIQKILPDLTILPIIWSPQEKQYRNKIEFSFGKYITRWPKTSSSLSSPPRTLSDRSLGFHKQGEFSKIVDISTCALISEEATAIFQYLKNLCIASWLPVYDQMTHQWFFRHLVIRQGFGTQQFLVNLAVSDNNLKEKYTPLWDTFLETLKQDSFLADHVTTLVITYNNGLADIIRSQECDTKTFWWSWYIYEKLFFFSRSKTPLTTDTENTETPEQNLSEISFRISPFSFFQTNTLWAQQLFDQAMQMVGYVEGTILDLYCGTWSIGISFLKLGKGNRLVGIEIVPEAITDARYNAKINGLDDQVFFVAAPAEKAFIDIPEIKTHIDHLWLVIVDPPRDGLHKNVIQTLCELKRESDFKLLYISCNPVTMVRDIELLIQGGFTIKELQPVDMFPQTHHIECIWVFA